MWVSDRIFEITNAENLTDNAHYKLCKHFDGAAVPGKPMKIDCDHPVTGRYITIVNGMVPIPGYSQPSLQICDWKVYGIVCKYKVLYCCVTIVLNAFLF